MGLKTSVNVSKYQRVSTKCHPINNINLVEANIVPLALLYCITFSSFLKVNCTGCEIYLSIYVETTTVY